MEALRRINGLEYLRGQTEVAAWQLRQLIRQLRDTPDLGAADLGRLGAGMPRAVRCGAEVVPLPALVGPETPPRPGAKILEVVFDRAADDAPAEGAAAEGPADWIGGTLSWDPATSSEIFCVDLDQAGRHLLSNDTRTLREALGARTDRMPKTRLVRFWALVGK